MSKSLRIFSLFLVRIQRLSYRRPFTISLLLGCLAFTAYSNLKHLKFIFSAEDLVGTGISSADELQSVKERYEDGTSSILFLTPPKGTFSFTTQELCGLRRWYANIRAIHPEIKNAVSSFDAIWPTVQKPNSIKYENLLQLDCERVISERSPVDVKEIMDSSPWPALHERKDRLSLIFLFTFRNSNDPKFGSFNPAHVTALRDSAESEIPSLAPSARMHWIGPADYQWYVKKGFQFSAIVNSLMVLFLILSIRFCYGTWFGGILFCSTLIVTAICIYGLKAFLGSHYDVLSSGLFLILGVSALEDYTFVAAEQLKGSSWRKALRKLLVPSFFTSLTTMVGFASLATSNLDIVRSFGWWAAFGSFLEWIMLFVFTPAFLKLVNFKRQTWVNDSKAYGTKLFQSLSLFAIPRGLVKTSLVVFPLAVLSFFHLNPDDVPSRIFPQSHPYNQSLKEVISAKGWQSSVSLLMENEKSKEAIDSVIQKIKNDPEVGPNVIDYESATRTSRWIDSLKVLPKDYVKLHYEMSLNYKQLVDESGVARANLFLKDISVLDLQKLKQRVNEYCKDIGCHVGGDLIAYSDFSTMVPQTLLESMVTSLLLVAGIVVFLAYALGKQHLIVYLLTSAFWGPALMLCVMAAFRIPMDFLKCIFASVLVGLTGDNAIQYLFASKKEDIEVGIANRGPASIQTNTFMALTSLLYLLSYFDPPKDFGVILSLGLMAALWGDLWLLNGLLNKSEKPV